MNNTTIIDFSEHLNNALKDFVEDKSSRIYVTAMMTDLQAKNLVENTSKSFASHSMSAKVINEALHSVYSMFTNGAIDLEKLNIRIDSTNLLQIAHILKCTNIAWYESSALQPKLKTIKLNDMKSLDEVLSYPSSIHTFYLHKLVPEKAVFNAAFNNYRDVNDNHVYEIDMETFELASTFYKFKFSF